MNKLFQILISILAFATPLSCVVGAILLALNGVGGWGWFLFIALMFSVNARFEY